MRILAMSDTHTRHRRLSLPEADLFIHAGDFTNFGNGAEEFAIWFWQLPYKQKLLVLGNHENAHAIEQRPLDVWRKLFGPALLHGEAREARSGDERVVVYGAPYGMHAFAGAPDGIGVAVTHEPPYGVLDRASGGHIGEAAVGEFVARIRPAVHLFGHAHACGGESIVRDATLHVNAATRAVLIETGDGSESSVECVFR